MADPFLPRPLHKAIDVGVIACGWWLLALSAATCVEMVSRKLFRFSLQGVDEIGAYTLAVTSALGFSYTLVTRGHTRIDFVLTKLPVKAQGLLNVLAALTLAALALFATWRGWTVLSESIEFQSTSTTPLQTPLWIPQTLWYVGWVLFAVAALFLLFDAVGSLVKGDIAGLNRRHGPQTLEEEIESEMGSAESPK